MTDIQIDTLIRQSLENVKSNDNCLLVNDLSEQSISHRIAYYLTPMFADYNVDCEYNGDIDKENNKKAIYILKQELAQSGLLREKEASDLEKELTSRAVFPDIIVHRRGSNAHNLCILEVKKSSSRVDYAYDFIKLQAYTSSRYDNTLKYQLGIFIEVMVGNPEPDFNLKYYKDGYEVNL